MRFTKLAHATHGGADYIDAVYATVTAADKAKSPFPACKACGKRVAFTSTVCYHCGAAIAKAEGKE